MCCTVQVSGCIKSLQEAGITVRMATGDNIQTARAIAEKCGIINGKWDDHHLHLALDRKEFNEKVMDVNGAIVQQKLDGIWPQLRVLAGCSPTDKYNLVSRCGHSRCKEVVAFVGRGTSDAVTMKVADVGIAMVIYSLAGFMSEFHARSWEQINVLCQYSRAGKA